MPAVLELIGVAALAAGVAALIRLGPSPRRRTIGPEFRGLRVSETWGIALPAHVGLEVFSLAWDPKPTDGLATGQEPLPGCEVKWGSVVRLHVDFPERDN